MTAAVDLRARADLLTAAADKAMTELLNPVLAVLLSSTAALLRDTAAAMERPGLTTDELTRRVMTVEGVRPTPAPLPPPGIYWVKSVSCDFYWIDRYGTRVDNPPHNEIWSVYTWDLPRWSAWTLVELTDVFGAFNYFGGDGNAQWERSHSIVVAVSARVVPPPD